MNGNFRVGEFFIEPQLNTITGAEKTTRIEPKVMQVLVCLADHAGEVVLKEKLIQSVWSDTFVTDDVLTRSISELRKVFDDDAKEPRFIQTIPRSGYRLIAPLVAGDLKQSAPPEITADRPEPAVDPDLRWTPNWIWTRFAQGRPAPWLTSLTILGLIVAMVLIIQFRPLPPPRIANTVQLTNDGREKNFFQLATDGSRVYFLEEDLGQTAGIAQVPISGGEPSLISAPLIEGPGVRLLDDISPDRTELLVGTAQVGEAPALWVMSVLGGARRLGDLRGHSACWSPDGQRIAYTIDQALYIARSDGTEPRKLLGSSANGFPKHPFWSPDGSRLRFQMSSEVTTTLWEISADGTNPHPLFPDWKPEPWAWFGRWTPDGRYYVFLVNSSGITPDIWAVRETRSFFGSVDRKPIQLTFGPMGFGPFVFSPDGKKLFAMGWLPRGELARYDIGSVHWVPFLSGMSATHLDFSRDGQWVTYITYPDGPLWRSRADGSQALQLTSPGMKVLGPRWSPDGKQIAFTRNVYGQLSKIYVVPADGGKAEQLVQWGCGEADATWSSDGNRLVFNVSGTSCPGAIYLIDLKSHQVSKIEGSDGLSSPRWSPDGNSIVAVTGDGSRLMLFSFATQRWEEVVKGGGGRARIENFGFGVSYPGWSRDGRSVYFINDSDVLRVRIADHKVEKVVSLTGVSLKNFSGLSLTPDDSPLVLRETSVHQLYALDFVAP